ncbi:hypothetical protein NDU88_010182 [Pleurodeles waltl]|uniref:Uncharacterized protein n=1 Tax=Pleurodeles waltl TaxID=8319 RepID=A0AAV7QV63_PLEWA|nr:hypothetical protein NDU88_010182 [Pleurodeles waltl]
MEASADGLFGNYFKEKCFLVLLSRVRKHHLKYDTLEPAKKLTPMVGRMSEYHESKAMEHLQERNEKADHVPRETSRLL